MSSVKRCSAVGMLLLLMITTGTVSGQEQKPEMVVQMGHTSGVRALAFSSCGKYLLSGANDTIKLWDINTGKELRTFSGHTSSIKSLAFSPDGSAVMSLSLSNTIIIWDLTNGEKLRTLLGPAHPVLTAAFSPDGKKAVSGGFDGTIKLWSLDNCEELRSFSKHSGAVNYITFSGNGKYVISGSHDKTMKFWDINTGRLLRSRPWDYVRITSLDFTYNGDKAVLGYNDGSVKIWDLGSDKIMDFSPGHRKGVTSVKFSPNEMKVISASYDGTAKLWETETGKELHTFLDDLEGIQTAAFSNDGEIIFSGSYANTIKTWDAVTGQELTKMGCFSDKINSVAVSQSGTKCLAGSSDRTVKLWDISKSSILWTFSGFEEAVTSAVFAPDEKTILSASSDNTIKLINSSDGDELKTFTGHSKGVNTVAFSPSGETFLSGSYDNTVRLWDLESGKERVALLGHSDSVRTVIYSPDGNTAFSGSDDWKIKLWDLISFEELSTFSSESFFVESVDISPDGSKLIAGYGDQTIKLYDLTNGEVLKTFFGHSSNISSVAFSPGGEKFISGSYDKTIKMWDISSGKQVRGFEAHSAAVREVDFFSESNCILSGSSDGTMRIWNIETGEWVSFTANADGSEWLIFDSDGYWDASPNGGEMVAMVRGMECWNIDQFAVRNNRPDLILKKLPDADQELIGHYRNQYLRRLRRLGLVEEELSKDYHVPAAEIVEGRQEGKYIDLRFVLEDKKVPLKSYNIYVNDVPIFGAYGRELDDAAAGGRTTLTDRIELSAGENKIEVSCMNEAGAEAFRPVVYASYDGPVERDLYYIGFGVSEYRDESLDLRYAHKDAEDLGKLFGTIDHGPPRTGPGAGGGAYRRVITRTYTDEEVTRENIAAAKSLLEQASVDDTVVLMISGHGIHDRDKYATYYYLTHETDLDNLSQTAVEFEELEELLQGIPPRQKLFLMDTCGSGEWDPETARKVARADEAAAEEGSAGKGVWSRMPSGLNERADGKMERNGGDAAVRGGGTDPRRGVVKEAGAARTYLSDKDRYIYNDLVRRSGAIVFSSCRGDEVSYESAEYENGLFTEYIIRGLGGDQGGRGVEEPGTRPADGDGDGVVTTEELRQYVRSGVAAETGEDPLLYAVPQHPTVDRDNIYVEFGF